MEENRGRSLFFIGVLLATAAGCGPGSLGPDFQDAATATDAGTDTSPPLACERAQTLLGACVACHSVASAATNGGGFDMETAGWEKKLVGMSTPASAPDTSLCKGRNLAFLEPRTLPARGLFLDKIQLAMPPCGVQMPRLLPKLGAADVACIQAWANGVVAAASSP